MCEDDDDRKIEAIGINERDAAVDLHIIVDNTEFDVEEVVRHIEAKVNLCIDSSFLASVTRPSPATSRRASSCTSAPIPSAAR